MFSARRFSPMLVGFVAVSLALLATSCAQDDPTEPTVSDITLAKGGGPGPKVSEAIPPDAPQDTTLDVQIIGSGFDDGSEVTMTLDGSVTGKVHTNSTQFVSSRELRANITIDLEADTALYDVEVMTMRGKKGVGVDMFKVRLKGSSSESQSGFAVVISEWTGAITSPSGDVAAGVTNDGRLDAATDGIAKGKNSTPGKELCIDLSRVSSVVDYQALADFEARVAQDGSTMDNACTIVRMHTRNHSNYEEGKMRGQAVGATEHSGGKIVLKDFGEGADSWEWRLMWDGPGNVGSVPPTPDLGQGVCIDHPDATTWHVYNDDDVAGESGACVARGTTSVDNIAELWRVYQVKTKPPSTVWVHVAEFVVPFRFTVTRQ